MKCGYCGRPTDTDRKEYCNTTCRVAAWRQRKRHLTWELAKPHPYKIFHQR